MTADKAEEILQELELVLPDMVAIVFAHHDVDIPDHLHADDPAMYVAAVFDYLKARITGQDHHPNTDPE